MSAKVRIGFVGVGGMNYARIVIPAGDWIASAFTDLIQSEDIRLWKGE